MSNHNFMPLNGALLISNPRENPMAYARPNPNDYRRINKLARLVVQENISPQQAVAMWLGSKHLPKKQRPEQLQRKRRGESSGKWLVENAHKLDKQPKSTRADYASAKRAVAAEFARQGGAEYAPRAPKKGARPASYAHRIYGTTKAGRYRWGKKRRKNARGHVVVDADAVRAYNKARLGRKSKLGYHDASAPMAQRWGQYAGRQYTYKTGKPKGSGTLIVEGFAHPVLPGHPIVRTKAERRRAGKKAAKSNAWIKFVKANEGSGLSMKQLSATYQKEKAEGKHPTVWTKDKDGRSVRRNPRRPKKGTPAYYRAKHQLAQQNYGALALDNYGALALDNYGALALDNPLPFVGGVVGASKLALTGLVGALGHAYIAPKAEDLIEKVPVIGGKLLDLEVPEVIPVIGGMSLTSTIVGILAGAAVIGVSQYAGQRFGIPAVSLYGSMLGTGIAIAGPVVDYASDHGDDEEEALEAEDLAGLALENYGGLALENQGTFGDGMAYEIGSIVQDDEEYGQASLADAYYSGADFGLGEGQALLNGRRAFRRRFGRAPHRIAPLGGRRAGASHLAGRKGHRWGWLIKMLGWDNTRKLAAMAPQKRVNAIKQLRANALATFQQLHTEAEASKLAEPELSPAPGGAEGAGGVNGVFGAYGATIFGGAGL